MSALGRNQTSAPRDADQRRRLTDLFGSTAELAIALGVGHAANLSHRGK